MTNCRVAALGLGLAVALMTASTIVVAAPMASADLMASKLPRSIVEVRGA